MFRIIRTLLLLSLGSAPASAGDPLAVLNYRGEDPRENRGSVSFIDPDSHAEIAAVETGLNPRSAAFGPQRRYVFVIDGGRSGAWAPNKGGTEASLTVVDARTQRVANVIPLDPLPRSIHFSDDGERAYVVCLGREHAPPSVLAVGVEHREIVGKVVYGDKMGHLGTVANTRITTALAPGGMLFIARQPWSINDNKPSELTVVDTTSMTVTARHELVQRASRITVSQNGDRVYVFCSGHRKRGAGRRLDQLGKLYVLDAKTGGMQATWDLGHRPRILSIRRPQEQIVIAAGAPKKGNRLIVIERGERRAVVETADRALEFHQQTAGADILILTEDRILAISPDTWEIERAIALPFRARQLLVGPDGKLAYIAAASGGSFAKVDLATGQWSPALASGRSGVKAGKTLGTVAGALAVFALAFVFAAGDVASDGLQPWDPITAVAQATESALTTPVYLPPAASPVLGLSQDGNRLLVLNQRTNDLTVADTEKWEILAKKSTGKGTSVLLPSPNGKHHYVLAAERLSVVDVTDELVVRDHEIDWSKWRGKIFILTDRREFWVPEKRGMDVFDLDSGELKKRVEDLPRPLVVLDPAA